MALAKHKYMIQLPAVREELIFKFKGKRNIRNY